MICIGACPSCCPALSINHLVVLASPSGCPVPVCFFFRHTSQSILLFYTSRPSLPPVLTISASLSCAGCHPSVFAYVPAIRLFIFRAQSLHHTRAPVIRPTFHLAPFIRPSCASNSSAIYKLFVSPSSQPFQPLNCMAVCHSNQPSVRISIQSTFRLSVHAANHPSV